MWQFLFIGEKQQVFSQQSGWGYKNWTWQQFLLIEFWNRRLNFSLMCLNLYTTWHTVVHILYINTLIWTFDEQTDNIKIWWSHSFSFPVCSVLSGFTAILRFHWLPSQHQRNGCWLDRRRQRQWPAVLHQDLYQSRQKSKKCYTAVFSSRLFTFYFMPMFHQILLNLILLCTVASNTENQAFIWNQLISETGIYF